MKILHSFARPKNSLLGLLLLVLPFSAAALDTINQVLLQHAQQFPRSLELELTATVAQLTAITTTDLQKAEVLFYWIADNITYDIVGLQTGEYITSVPETIRQGKGICHNYAQLYQTMCELAGLECHYIGGYAKGYSYRAEEPFKEINHAWNAVLIDGSYLFVDATWGSGFVGAKNGRIEFTPKVRIKEVLEPPGDFSATHLPGNAVWQLLERPISLQTFQAYETFEEMQASVSEQPPMSYLDSLSNFLDNDPAWQKVVAAHKTYWFNPTEENAWWVGIAYWGYGDHLTEGRYSSTRFRKALSSYQSAIACFKGVTMRYEAAQQEIARIRHNIKYVRYRLDMGR